MYDDDPDELAAHLRDAGAGVLAPVDVKSGVCDECGLEVTESYCPDCGMWVCDDCWPAHESGDVDFDDEDELDDAGAVAPARDGEQMGVWVYADGYNAWLYTASYHDYEPCYRRSETLARAYGVWCGVLRGEDGEWYPYAPREYTALLRERSSGDGGC